MSSRLFPRKAVTFALLVCLCTFSMGIATPSNFVLNTKYSGNTFFDGFDFFTGPDPTNGFVNYVNRSTAETESLISYGSSSPAIMRADSFTNLTVGATVGRASVRIESKKTFTHGLIIADIAHMPGDDCGIWPAYWTLGPNWPHNGEIDIIEGVNSGFGQQMKNINYSTGCGVLAQSTDSYGNDFNAANGGVYATEWTSDYIRIWFFPRASIPGDIAAGSPDPTQWGLPQANFQGSCNLDYKFKDHKIIFDMTFCGDYAGSVFSTDAVCKKLAGTCNDYVAKNPQAFSNAFWSVNSIEVYDQIVPVSSTSSLSSPTSVIPNGSVSAPGMGFNSSTRTTAGTSPTGSSITKFGPWNYLGCASSTSGFPTFVEANDSAYSGNMAVDICTSLCGINSSAYAGLYKSRCYCAASLGSDSIVTPGSPGGGSCGIHCPGNSNEYCGGDNSTNGRLGSRQIQINFLLSVYINTAVTSLGPSVTSTKSAMSLTSAIPQNLVHGYGMGGGAASVVRTVISVTYIDVCPSCPAGYITITTSEYIQHCGCMDVPALPSTPTIIMTTVVKSCPVCEENGGPANVTVTVPYSYCPAVQTMSATCLGLSGGCIGGNSSGNGVVMGSGMQLTTATLTGAMQSPFPGSAAASEVVGTKVLVFAMGLVLAVLI